MAFSPVFDCGNICHGAPVPLFLSMVFIPNDYLGNSHGSHNSEGGIRELRWFSTSHGVWECTSIILSSDVNTFGFSIFLSGERRIPTSVLLKEKSAGKSPMPRTPSPSTLPKAGTKRWRRVKKLAQTLLVGVLLPHPGAHLAWAMKTFISFALRSCSCQHVHRGEKEWQTQGYHLSLHLQSQKTRSSLNTNPCGNHSVNCGVPYSLQKGQRGRPSTCHHGVIRWHLFPGKNLGNMNQKPLQLFGFLWILFIS